MKTTVNFYRFEQAFRDMGRAEQFSRGALEAIFDYVEEYEQDTGEEIELDVIALCCEWSEYGSALEAAKEYGYTPSPFDPTDEESQEEYEMCCEDEAMEWLEDRTQVRSFNGGIVMVQF